MSELRGLRGEVLKVGDVVVYGKSDRNSPIALGTIVNITEDTIHILKREYIVGKENKKASKIPTYHCGRLVVVPKDHIEGV